MLRRGRLLGLAKVVLAAGIGFGVGYLIWGWPTDWYAGHDPARLPQTPENDLVRYGWELVVNTTANIGPNVANLAMRFAGNNLACTNCHLNAGTTPFASPFISTLATFPMMVSDTVETLVERLDGCMTRSLNGKALPHDGREMQAIIAYIRFVGKDSPLGVRVPGMGLLPLRPAEQAPSVDRGKTVYAAQCTRCHGADGQGQRQVSTAIAYAIPPLWGTDSFNAAAGMARIEDAAAFIRANMPRGIDYTDPVLTEQQAWDVAAYMLAQPRPPGPGT